MPETKTRTHDDLANLKPKDRMAQVVQEIVLESRKSLTNVSLMHYEALMNSLGISPAESFVTSYTPYGQHPYPFSNFYDNKAIGQIMSPFTAEQVNAITTRLVAPLIGQREVLYVEPQGIEDQLKARVRERLWERCIRSPYTNWADLVWRTLRDVVVRSRAYWEVRPLRVRRMRRTYRYDDPDEIQRLMDAGLTPEEIQQVIGTIRTSQLETTTVWDGPVISPLIFGTVHKDKSETLISDSTLFVVIERMCSWQQFLIEGKAMFPVGSEVRFDSSQVPNSLVYGAEGYPDSPELGFGSQYGVQHIRPTAPIYEPIKWYEFRGIDPTGSAEEEVVSWVTGGVTVGSKLHDGSGSVQSVGEWCWDPINGLAGSSSPAMTIRTKQEQFSLLENCLLNAWLWQCNLAGAVNMDMVNDINQVKNLRPAQFFPAQGEGTPIFPIQIGKDAGALQQGLRGMEEAARLVTGGIASIVGGAPQGVGTLGEFAGITQGALDRIGTQLEINADTVLRRTFSLVLALWRDGLTTDAELATVLGQNEDTMGATLLDLEGDLDVIPMAARYHQVRKTQIDAITALLDRATQDPQLQARIKPSVYDDFAYAIAGPASRRWFAGEQELLAQGIDPATLKQQAIANAGQPGQPGTPSPPKAQPSSGADLVTQQGAQGGA